MTLVFEKASMDLVELYKNGTPHMAFIRGIITQLLLALKKLKVGDLFFQ